jgi:Holliday junction resolvasome RuvABC endonuclease subunit
MRNTQQTILGISPGTRSIGLVVYRNGTLSEWRVKTFKGSWSKIKLKDILYDLKCYITEQEITILAIKRPDALRSSAGVQQIVSEIIILAKRNNIKVFLYSLKELKEHLSKEKNLTKAQMIQLAASANAELHHEYNKEQRNRNSYYIKMFEAVIAVRTTLVQHKL